jgi:uncharacterized membrane protein
MTAESCLVPLKCAFGLTEIISPIVLIFTANGVVRNFLVQLQRWYVCGLWRTAWGLSRLNPTEQLSSVERSLSAVVVCWWHTQVLGCHFVCFWKVRHIPVLLCLTNTAFVYS